MSTVTNLLSSPEFVGTWTLMPDGSMFAFENKTMWGLANVRGRFTEFRGEGQLAGNGTVSGRIEITAASLTTKLGMRDRHLRSADFFDVEKYPHLVITVTGAEPTAGDEVNLEAELSARGRTIPLPLRAEVEALDDGGVRLAAKTTVEREQLGISGNLAGMMGNATALTAYAVFRRAGA
jgi:polyisoprenoid-binding protein YceI